MKIIKSAFVILILCLFFVACTREDAIEQDYIDLVKVHDELILNQLTMVPIEDYLLLMQSMSEQMGLSVIISIDDNEIINVVNEEEFVDRQDLQLLGIMDELDEGFGIYDRKDEIKVLFKTPSLEVERFIRHDR